MELFSIISKIKIFIFIFSFATISASAQNNKTIIIYDEYVNMYKYFWQPCGWMPDSEGLLFQSNYCNNCHLGNTCIKIGYYPEKDRIWVGIYWLADCSWKGQGINLYKEMGIEKNASIKLTFWAKGEVGGETAGFKVGGIKRDSTEIKWIQLSNEWKEYNINLSEIDLSDLFGGFCWVTFFNKNKTFLKNTSKNEVLIYLDDIKFVTY